VKLPVILAWTAISFIPLAHSQPEECQYTIEDADGGDRSLTLTANQFLQAPVDRNANFATIHAALLDFRDPEPDKRYLTVRMTVPLFVATKDEAEELRKDHSPVVPKGFPLLVNFVDDTSVILTSWGMGVGRGTAAVASPGRYGNDTEFFRVSHAYMGAYWIDDEQRAALMAKPVKRLQMTTAHGDHDITVKSQKADRIQYVVGCI